MSSNFKDVTIGKIFILKASSSERRHEHRCRPRSRDFDTDRIVRANRFHFYGRPIGQAILFSYCGFFFLSSFFPRLLSAVADWMSTILLHMMWPYCEFRM